MEFDDSSDDEAPELLLLSDDINNDTLKSKEEVLDPCPVTILSGFLGSGKTTLIQYILRSNSHGKRIAVIENEFGGGSNKGLSIESMIASDGSQSLMDLIELPNGCVCCTVKDDLVQTLEVLLEKRKDLDYIIIEASGMANPGPIASVFWLDNALDSRLRLDGIVTLVDASNIGRQLMETTEASQQIAYADRLLMNKIDLITEKKESEILSLIRTIHPTAPIRKTEFAKVVDLDWILDSKSFDNNSIESPKLVEKDEPTTLNDTFTIAYNDLPFCLPIVPSHGHTNSVRTFTFSNAGSIRLRKVNAWFASILWPNQDEEDRILRAHLESGTIAPINNKENGSNAMEIFRIKGILSVKHDIDSVDEEDKPFVNNKGIDSRRFVVQAVYDLWEIYPGSKNLNWMEYDEHISKIILIGRNLDGPLLRQGFQSCFI